MEGDGETASLSISETADVIFPLVEDLPHYEASVRKKEKGRRTPRGNFSLKGALCSFGEGLLIRGDESSLTEDNTYCPTLFICVGPCHLCSFKQCSGTLFSPENSLFIQLWKNK